MRCGSRGPVVLLWTNPDTQHSQTGRRRCLSGGVRPATNDVGSGGGGPGSCFNYTRKTPARTAARQASAEGPPPPSRAGGSCNLGTCRLCCCVVTPRMPCRPLRRSARVGCNAAVAPGGAYLARRRRHSPGAAHRPHPSNHRGQGSRPCPWKKTGSSAGEDCSKEEATTNSKYSCHTHPNRRDELCFLPDAKRILRR